MPSYPSHAVISQAPNFSFLSSQMSLKSDHFCSLLLTPWCMLSKFLVLFLHVVYNYIDFGGSIYKHQFLPLDSKLLVESDNV